MSDDAFDDDPDTEAWSVNPHLLDDEVATAMTGFFMLVRVETGDGAFARLGIEAIVRSLRDSVGPDAPILGMIGIPTLIEDGLARAALADASPSAREALGDLERLIVRTGPAAAAAAAGRIRAAIRAANTRLADGRAAGPPGAAGHPGTADRQ
jgi:hypothetical protein